MNKISIPKNTLLFVHISTHFKEMMRVARLMKQNGGFQPYLFFIQDMKELNETSSNVNQREFSILLILILMYLSLNIVLNKE